MGAASAAAAGIDSYFSKQKGQTPKPAPPASPKTPGENPIDNPSAYDSMEIAGMRTPGLCKLTGCDRAYDWKVQAAHGSDGASTTLTGVKIIEPSFELTLWESEHFVAWETLERILTDSIKGDKAKPLAARHPEMTRKGFAAFSVKKIGQLAPGPGGTSKVKVEILEFKPPKPKAAVTQSWKTKFDAALEHNVNLARHVTDQAYQLQQQHEKTLETQGQPIGTFDTIEETFKARGIGQSPEEREQFSQ